MTLSLLRVTDAARRITETQWLARAECVHRQLRPMLESDYLSQMQRIVAQGGEIVLAMAASEVRGVALYRVFENTFVGRRFYVDDLVTDETFRSQGVGRALIAWLEQEARARQCPGIELESGVQRPDAHRFYFREGFIITSFSFRKKFQ